MMEADGLLACVCLFESVPVDMNLSTMNLFRRSEAFAYSHLDRKAGMLGPLV